MRGCLPRAWDLEEARCSPNLHRSAPDRNCVVGKHVQDAMRPALDKARQALEDELARVTIDDIAAEIARRGGFTIPWQA